MSHQPGRWCCIFFSTKAINSRMTMKLESAATGKEVLQLVHPGGIVEVHQQPIAAAEVLEKNPRQSIAQPDVFQNPWAVVNLDDMLRPGEVFFIVPNWKINQLLKACREGCQHSPDQLPSQSPIRTSCTRTTSQQQEGTKRPRRHCKAERLKVVSKCKNTHLQDEERPAGNTPLNIRTCHRDEYLSNDGHAEDKITRELTALKSCLRSHDSVCKSLRHKVSFVLPVKDSA